MGGAALDVNVALVCQEAGIAGLEFRRVRITEAAILQLALVSRTLRDEGLRAKLRANDDPVALHAVLAEAPDSPAA